MRLSLLAFSWSVGAAAALQIPLTVPLTTVSNPLLSPEFDAFASGLLEQWGVPGMAVGVVKLVPGEESITEFRSFGSAGGNIAVTEDTLFGIASNSKAFTAAALGILQDRGEFNFSQKVVDLLPEFKLLDPIASNLVNVRDIMSHRTGMPRHDASYQHTEHHAELVKRMRYLRLSAELRETWQYNNQMFITGALLVTRYAKLKFTSFVVDNIFAPLGMSASTYFSAQEDDPLLSASYLTLSNNTAVEIPYGFGDLSKAAVETAAGAGGIVTSARDMVKWLEFLLSQANATNASQTRYDSVLSSDFVKEMIGFQMPITRSSPYPESSPAGYGFGTMPSHYQGVQIVRHGGSIPGFGSQVVWSPSLGIGIVALCNTADTGNAVSDIVSYRAFDEVAGLSLVDWNSRYMDKKRVADAKRQDAISKARAHPSPAPPLDYAHLLGTYHDPGYGDISICSPTAPHPSHRCAKVIHRAETAEPLTPVPPQVLYAASHGFFSQSWIGLLPPRAEEPMTFRAVPTSLYGPTESRNHSLVAYEFGSGDVTAKFVKGKKGWELQLWGVWGPGEEVDDSKEPEVIFHQVK